MKSQTRLAAAAIAAILAAMPFASRAADFEEEVVAEAAVSMVEWKPDTNNGSVQLPLSKQREAILRFDVNGMANATNVKARFYCSAHLASAATPVVLRVMRDVAWDPSSATPNTMKHEIPFFPSTWIGRGDPLFAGSFNVSAANAYYEADVTEAAREAARTTGKLALHVYSAWWHEDSEWSILEGPGTAVEAQRPRLVAQWADSTRSPAIPGLTETIELAPTDDMYANSTSKAVTDSGYLYARAWGTEAFMKFATSAFAGRVVSATLKLSLSSAVDASNPWEVTLQNGGDWSETETTLPSGLSVLNNWYNSAPADTVRITTGLAAENTVDVTSLVTKGQDFASGFLTFRLNAKNWSPHAAFYSKEEADATKRPKLIVVVRKSVSASRVGDAVTVSWQAVGGASSYRVARADDPEGPFETVATVTGTSAVDPTCPGKATYWYRVFSVAGNVETTVDTIRFSENTTTASRAALFDCGVNSASQSTPVYNQSSYQIGCQQWDSVTRAMYICFDPNGLEEAPYVRLRVKTVWANGLTGQNKPARLFGAVTDRFDPTNVCWSSAVFGLPVRAPVAAGTTYDDELGRVSFGVTATDFSPYLEFDVTEVVREAARQGRYASFQLSLEAANANYARWIAGVASGTPPVLLYPPVEGFGRLSAEDDLGDENPKVHLAWSAGPAGTTYTVERTVSAKHEHSVLASGISATEYLDRSPFVEETVYKVTANLSNGQTSVQELTHTVDAAVRIRASADTHVFGAESGRDATYGTARSLQVKYDSWGTVNREGVLRFNLESVPENFRKAYLRLRILHSNAPNAYDKVCFRTVSDFVWTDAAAPSWRDLLGNQIGSTLSSASGVFATFYPGTTTLWADGTELSIDMTATVRAAKAAGQQAVTVHFYPLEGVSDMIQFYSRESGMSGYAPYLSIVPKNWHPQAFVMVFR